MGDSRNVTAEKRQPLRVLCRGRNRVRIAKERTGLVREGHMYL